MSSPIARSSAASRRRIKSQRGFTLATLLVLLTVLMVFIAYTVPTYWSTIMKRERERQTIYAMQQYARAIREFNKKHGAYPVSIDQLKEARLPRFIRSKGEYPDPLTGEVDWLIVPATAAGQGVQPGGGGRVGVGVGTSDDNGAKGGSGSQGSQAGPTSTDTSGQGKPASQGIPIKDYAGGPFIGVRPSKTGLSMIEFRGAKSYEEWSYTSVDLELEITQRNQAAATLFAR